MNDWRASSGPTIARNRAAMLQRVRRYFERQNVLEVDTPALGLSAPSDLHIDCLRVSSATEDADLYLQPSPEFCMKRLLADGYPDIYAICRVFRDNEQGPRHQPEFTLLEWYRLDFGLDAIVSDTIRLIAVALDDPHLSDNVSNMDYSDAFRAAVGLDPIHAPISQLADAADADDTLRESLGDCRDGWLDLLLTDKVAPSFAADSLTVLKHYPASQAALARICPSDARVADRFEVFFGDTELANGYVELRDASTQTARFAADLERRAADGKTQPPIDNKLIEALQSGLPRCSGVAVGIERLHMCNEKTDDIRNVITFAFEDRDD